MTGRLTKYAEILQALHLKPELEKPNQALLFAQEEERKRIAADLHDGIGQNLSAIQLAIGGLRKALEDRVAAEEDEQFAHLIHYVAQTMEDVRRISMDLRPSMLDDLGIVSTVDWFCDGLRPVLSNAGVDMIKTVRASEDAIPAPVKVAIFRIMQEACSNACKHAQPRRLSVLLETDAEGIRLEVADDGMGFRPASVQRTVPGFGLDSMRERAAMTGGHLTIRSQPEKGTRIVATWQAQEAVEETTPRLSIV